MLAKAQPGGEGQGSRDYFLVWGLCILSIIVQDRTLTYSAEQVECKLLKWLGLEHDVQKGAASPGLVQHNEKVKRGCY